MPDATTAGIRIRYDDIGRGEPALLCLPGWAAERSFFSALRSSEHRRVLSLDWRGHGGSERPSGDFGNIDLVQDALAVIEDSGAQRIVPVSHSHAGWIAIELRRRLAERIPKLVLLDWIVLPPPQGFLDVLRGLRSADRWREVRGQLFDMWLNGTSDREITHLVRDVMGSYGFDTWSRAAREISVAYAQDGYPLKALSALSPPVPVLHLYSQPDDPAYLAAQQAFARQHPWFSVQRLEARTHVPMVEAAEELTDAIEAFLARPGAWEPAPSPGDVAG